MKNKIVIYTALFGDYDTLKECYKKSKNCDYICFTNLKSIKSKTWRVIFVEDNNIDDNIKNRIFKMLPHIFLKEYEYSLYVDANIRIMSDPELLIDKYLMESDFAAPIHPLRSCLYDEAVACVRESKAKKDVIDRQVQYYMQNKIPHNYGLFEMNVILRRHNVEGVKNLMDIWWNDYLMWSKRDQLSFMYAVYQNKYHVIGMEEVAQNINKFFFKECHKKCSMRNRAKNYIKKYIYILISKIRYA